MVRRKNVLTAQLQIEIDKEKDGRHVDKINVIIAPPDAVDDIISDNEELDDNVEIINNDNQLLRKVTGNFEIEYHYNNDNVHCRLPNDDITMDNYEPQPSRGNSIHEKSNYNHRNNFEFAKKPFDDTENSYKANEQIGSNTPMQLSECFIDNEVLQLIVDYTSEYAGQNNVPDFVTTTNEIRTFLSILYITGFHTLPNIHTYWSNRASLGCQLIKDAIGKDRFKRIKENVCVCDNKILNKNDKFSKISPLNDIMNHKCMQFGVLLHNLSIDEQMIAYYGRHSCKMFVKGMPIRFDYKYWCLTSSDGYCYQFMPYAGASANKNTNYALGENVVLQVLSHLETPERHNVTFNNFFTGHKLMCQLNALGYFGTRTLRDNRTNRVMKKQPRDTSNFRFDKSNSLLAVNWNDNSVLAMMVNFLRKSPMCSAQGYDRKNWEMTTIEQQLLIHEYNQRMGNDLFDNDTNNYKIRIRGRRWYWPLITNAFDAAMVNAWKLHLLYAKYEATPASQFFFRMKVVEALVTLPEVSHSNGEVITTIHEMARCMERKISRRTHCGQCGIKTEFGCEKCKKALHSKCLLYYHIGIPWNEAKIKEI